MTYILPPSARRGPEADSSCPAAGRGGETDDDTHRPRLASPPRTADQDEKATRRLLNSAPGLCPTPGGKRLRPPRRPRRQVGGPSPTATPLTVPAPPCVEGRAQPLPGAGGGDGKFPRGGVRRAPLPLCRSDRLREGGRKGGRRPPR